MKIIVLASVLSLGVYCTPKERKREIPRIQLEVTQSEESVSDQRNPVNERITDTLYPIFEKNIEQRISTMFAEKKTKAVDEQLMSLDAQDSMSQSQKTYWKSYLHYFKSIFYKTVLNDDVQARESIEVAIALIGKKTTTSEDFALLAAAHSFSIQFNSMIKLNKIASQVEENAQKSLALNRANLRAYLVLATQNFYTPKMFGGMKKVEGYALKGLACPDALDAAFYSPHWGRKRLYDLLIQFYELEDRKDDMQRLKEKYNNQ
ncbi:hypothetical protein [Flavobacterium sp. JP2137]|uniref:hypothetical protein n=1 Tax=Flavobacterium sp. JP2137 TaxID=3414510 RepID=UPI003D2FA9B0